MGSQEMSKPVVIGVLVVAILIIGFLGWWFFLRSPAPVTSGMPAAPPGMGGQPTPGGYPGGPPGGPPAGPR